jgi:hypothetical protein
MSDKFFDTVRGGFTLHGDSGDQYTSTQFCLARFGESPDRVLEVFYQENPQANYLLVPLFAYGLPPRRELCTQQSLAAALQSVTLERDSIVETKWKQLAEEFDCSWPKRLSRYNKQETEPKAA